MHQTPINMSFQPIYKLRKWVPSIQHLDYENALNNERCVDELIKQDMVNISDLSAHPCAIDLIEKNMEEVNIVELSRNPAAVHLFKKISRDIGIVEQLRTIDYLDIQKGKNVDKLCLYEIAQNPEAVSYVERNYGYLLDNNYPCNNNKDYNRKRAITLGLSSNPNAIHILEKLNDTWIDIDELLTNPNGWKILEQRKTLRKKALKSNQVDYLYAHSEESLNFVTKYDPGNIDRQSMWIALHYNPSNNALKTLKTKPHEISWEALCQNESPYAIEYLKKNKNRIHWDLLSGNPGAIDLLEEMALKEPNSVHEKMDLNKLATNKEIYILDYEKMKEKINTPLVNDLSFVEELVHKVFHPVRVEKYLVEHQYDLLDDCYVD